MVSSVEKIVYLVPIVFFALQNLWIYLIKHELDKVSIILGVLTLPVVTSFYFLESQAGQIYFAISILVSVCILTTALFAERAEREKWFMGLLVSSILLTLLEYYWLMS